MKLTINELRQLVKEQLATIGKKQVKQVNTFGGDDDDELDMASAMALFQQKIAELEDKINDAEAQIDRVKKAQHTDEKDKTEEKTEKAATEATDILGDLDLGGE
jgi:uncharacterized protein YlxW (UPF0749 family)